MRIVGRSRETFLYLNGLRVDRMLRLGAQAELLPATCAPKPDDLIAVSKSETDLAVITLFLRSVSSQIRVSANSPQNLAVTAWNTVWDVLLLSAFCHCEVGCNLQSDVPAEKFGPKSGLAVTNYHLRGLCLNEPHLVTNDEAKWIESSIPRAHALLEVSAFQSAVHCLASYRWHSLPRVRLAIIWAGIEGLFGVESEISFRLSLYVARFLAPNDEAKRSHIFNSVRRLYKQRSAAVHGSQVKGDLDAGVAESAQLLLELLCQCVSHSGLPKTETLAP
jgi:hypothetical protein